jgi:hypothetical protein
MDRVRALSLPRPIIIIIIIIITDTIILLALGLSRGLILAPQEKSLEVALAPNSGAAVTESPQRWMDMEPTAIPSCRLARYPKEPSALHFAITHAQSNPIKHKLDTHVSLEWMLRAKKTLMDCIHHWLIANKKQNALNINDNIYILY